MLRSLRRIDPALGRVVAVGIAAVASSIAGDSFEVASIRLNLSGESGSYSSTRNWRYIDRNQSLRDRIEHAYDVVEWQISGPAWILSERFDVIAKPPAGTSSDQFEVMMQNRMAERFKLQIHREQRERAVYVLVVAKAGLKAMSAAADGKASTKWSRDHISAQHMPMAQFAERLSRVADRPVVDSTGLQGAFDFELKWTPENAEAKPVENARGPITDAPPSLFTAIEEQLGLKLEPRKAPVEILVVDHAEKVPSEN
jgi:uncharacterized protein (TIGR03435 family)